MGEGLLTGRERVGLGFGRDNTLARIEEEMSHVLCGTHI